ncbi:MAG: poly-beta-1,6-N-acetyl-D-glucosamine biosynthesis protein PgaD [Desulfobacteraceae bacterium]|nr:poly-beta-1,6-N-acetyl-D-glucosamine biosynthesis protein PgaD [Desulfobacteraceae bacterium]
MKNHIHIENNPDLRSFMRNGAEFSFTTAMWVLWIYLFLPLVSLAVWLSGSHYVYIFIFKEATLIKLMQLCINMCWVVVIVFILLRGWGYYNYFVFGKKNRRINHSTLPIAKLASRFSVSEDEARSLKNKKEILWDKLYNDIKAISDK